MGSRRPFGSILGGFSKVLGRFWGGFGTDLGDFWNGFGLILERIWYMRGNWFWTWTWAWMQRFGLLCALSPGKKHISVEPTLHFNQSLSMSGPPRCLAKLRGASQCARGSLPLRVLNDEFIIPTSVLLWEGFAPPWGGHAETAAFFIYLLVGVVFRTFSYFFLLFSHFFRFLRHHALFNRFFFGFSSIFGGFPEDLEGGLERFFEDFEHFHWKLRFCKI